MSEREATRTRRLGPSDCSDGPPAATQLPPPIALGGHLQPEVAHRRAYRVLASYVKIDAPWGPAGARPRPYCVNDAYAPVSPRSEGQVRTASGYGRAGRPAPGRAGLSLSYVHTLSVRSRPQRAAMHPSAQSGSWSAYFSIQSNTVHQIEASPAAGNTDAFSSSRSWRSRCPDTSVLPITSSGRRLASFAPIPAAASTSMRARQGKGRSTNDG